MQVGGIALKGARDDFDKGQAVAVVGVHIGVNFKHKARKGRFGGFNNTGVRTFGLRSRGDVDKTVQQILHPKIVEGRPKKHWL